ncbi:MAG: hypothetical protein RIR85_814 [Pseudomonadota bacterium]
MDITPSTAETLHSQLLAQKIQQEIIANNGAISFSKYMEMALYAPGLGYYAAGRTKLGQHGDFTTAPEISPLFGATITQTLLPVIERLKTEGLPINILEFGAGSGALAESILDALKNDGVAIDSYNILDLSADLIDRQKNKLKGRSENICWINQLPKQFTGIILANEVLDAMPVELITLIDGEWRYKDVGINKNSNDSITFTFCPGAKVPDELIPKHLQAANLINGYTTEIHPQSQAWIKTLGQCLDQGIFLTIDYGFPEHEYYHPQRHMGTLMCHQGHQSDTNPLVQVGRKDITAHVNFTGVALAGQEVGLQVLGYTSQAHFLINSGLLPLLENASVQERSRAQTLIQDHEMGELFKVIALAPGEPWTPMGFVQADRTHRL